MRAERYIGRSVEMIYLDRKNRYSKRVITVHRIRGNLVFGYDHTKRAFRTFRKDQILALMIVPA